MNAVEIFGSVEEQFERWWQREGQSLDPDTSDVPWYDKRKGLAALAWHAAMATSGNYVANTEIDATEFCYANGRHVSVCTRIDGSCPTLSHFPPEIKGRVEG